MEFLREIPAYLFERNDNAIFFCGEDMILQKVSPALPVSSGSTLASLFDDPAEYDRAMNELAHGTVFITHACSPFRPYSSILLLPILENETLSGVLGVLETPFTQNRNSSALFAVQVSDRYRTPVTNILNMLSTLSGALQGEEHARERVYLNAAAKECYAILRGVLPSQCYAQLVNGTMPFSPQPILLSEMLEDLQALLRPFFRKRGQTIRLYLPEKVIAVLADSRLLSMALFHLIANAAAFSPLDSTITISVKMLEKQCTISVTDEGDGIAAEYLPRVFEPFFTCPDNHLPEEEMGSGLGLPTVKAIAELHGGDVLLTSEKNKGTTVTIRLPLLEQTPDIRLVHADTGKYAADKFSDLYVFFSGLCDIDLFYE